MENFTIDARQIKAAMFMQAKNDIRRYLNGILIGDGKVVATDGHRLIVVGSPESSFEQKIFTIKGKIPARSMLCEFVFIGDDHGVVTSKDSIGNDIDAIVKFVIVDGKYPDYKKVMPTGTGDSVSEVGLNISYVADVQKAAIALGSQFSHGTFEFHEKQVVIKINTPENKATCVIMQVRI